MEMGRWVRSCVQATLKVVNSVIGMVGMGMILYSLWMIRVWKKQSDGFWAPAGSDSTTPWFVIRILLTDCILSFFTFIYTFLGLGISFCLITCSGHIAAETANGHCLSCYMVFVFLLVLLEAAITVDVFLNKNWEEDLPEDPTGNFDDLKDFVRSNFEMCKWISLSIVVAQVISIFLAVVLRALGTDNANCYDSDDEYVPARLPLLRNQVQQTPYVPNAQSSVKNKYWDTRSSR